MILRGGDKGLETVPEIQLTDYRDKKRARIRATPGLFALNEEISVLIRLCGGGRSLYRTRLSIRTSL